jgi:hypothetical protein
LQIAGCDQPLEWIGRKRREHGNRPTPVGDLDALAPLDSP